MTLRLQTSDVLIISSIVLFYLNKVIKNKKLVTKRLIFDTNSPYDHIVNKNKLSETKGNS